ncbi:MAG TPA: hypothetical protein VHL09_11670 [Dehalococcoidia bacterium]|nr:hypothetical protein [Dehalococcoidia bacterium]
MPVFPSLEWFQALRDVVNQDEEYRHYGTCDAEMGVKVGDKLYRITFEAFEVAGVAEIGEDDLRDCDFYLEMPPDAWREMLSNIREHGGADLSHTLNTLDFNLGGVAKSDDEYRRDLFYRYNQSFQQFFDDSRLIETRFA